MDGHDHLLGRQSNLLYVSLKDLLLII